MRGQLCGTLVYWASTLDKLDQGGSLDATGAELNSASVPVQLSRPRPGWVESDPEDWWLSVKTAVGRVLALAKLRLAQLVCQVRCTGGSCALGRNLARPAMLWLDRRAEASLGAYRGLAPHTSQF